jgi:CRISPR-associated protein Cas5d
MIHPTVKVRFFGPFAAFVGEKKDEPSSFPAPTPSAARGFLEAVLWKPAIFWHIVRIFLLKPIRWFTMRTNEVADRYEEDRPIVIEHSRTQRTLTGLRDVDYVVEAGFSFTPKRRPDEPPTKFFDMLHRRVALGQCKFQPYLGRRDFTGFFEPAPENFVPDASLLGKTIDLGMMPLDRHYGKTIVQEFFHAEIKDGVLVEKGKDALPVFYPNGEGDAR